MDDWVSAGFFVFEPAVFEYLRDGDEVMLEQSHWPVWPPTVSWRHIATTGSGSPWTPTASQFS